MIVPDVALVTFRREVRFEKCIKHANRSSLWVRDAAGWKLRFHQGTPLPIED
jgi:hypothetical protein